MSPRRPLSVQYVTSSPTFLNNEALAKKTWSPQSSIHEGFTQCSNPRAKLQKEIRSATHVLRRTSADVKKLQTQKAKVTCEMDRRAQEQERFYVRTEETIRTLLSKERNLEDALVNKIKEESECRQRIENLRKQLESVKTRSQPSSPTNGLFSPTRSLCDIPPSGNMMLDVVRLNDPSEEELARLRRENERLRSQINGKATVPAELGIPTKFPLGTITESKTWSPKTPTASAITMSQSRSAGGYTYAYFPESMNLSGQVVSAGLHSGRLLNVDVDGGNSSGYPSRSTSPVGSIRVKDSSNSGYSTRRVVRQISPSRQPATQAVDLGEWPYWQAPTVSTTSVQAAALQASSPRGIGSTLSPAMGATWSSAQPQLQSWWGQPQQTVPTYSGIALQSSTQSFNTLPRATGASPSLNP